MTSKRFDDLRAFARYGVNIHLTCRDAHCDHFGIVDPHEAVRWFKLHRWSIVLEGFGESALDHFYCTRCRARAGRARPTQNAPTVNDFFPADDRGWQMLQRRLRGECRRRVT